MPVIGGFLFDVCHCLQNPLSTAALCEGTACRRPSTRQRPASSVVPPKTSTFSGASSGTQLSFCGQSRAPGAWWWSIGPAKGDITDIDAARRPGRTSDILRTSPDRSLGGLSSRPKTGWDSNSPSAAPAGRGRRKIIGSSPISGKVRVPLLCFQLHTHEQRRGTRTSLPSDGAPELGDKANNQ